MRENKNFIFARNDIREYFEQDDKDTALRNEKLVELAALDGAKIPAEQLIKKWEFVKTKLYECGLSVALVKNLMNVEGGKALVIMISIYKNSSLLFQTVAQSEMLALNKLQEFFETHSIVYF